MKNLSTSGIAYRSQLIEVDGLKKSNFSKLLGADELEKLDKLEGNAFRQLCTSSKEDESAFLGKRFFLDLGAARAILENWESFSAWHSQEFAKEIEFQKALKIRKGIFSTRRFLDSLPAEIVLNASYSNAQLREMLA